MLRYTFVAGFYIAAVVLAAPAPGQDAIAAAGQSNRNPSSGSSLFVWPRLTHDKTDSATNLSEAGSPSTLFAPPASTRDWAGLFGGNLHGKGKKGTEGGSGAQPQSPSRGGQPSSGSRDWGSLFGGGSRVPPGGFSGGGLFGGWSKPRPVSGSSSGGSGRPSSQSSKPKPVKPDSAQPKPEAAAPDPKPVAEEAPKPEPAKPESEVAKAGPEATKSESKPVPEATTPEPKPAPEVNKPDPKPDPKPAPEVTKAEPKPVAKPAPEKAKPEPKPVNPEPAKPGNADVEAGAETEQNSVCGPRKYNKITDIESVRRKLWQPTVGAKWQIILDGVPDTKGPMEPRDATVWDIDAWDAKASDICEAKKKGKKVICYFSAGTSENWRPDYRLIAPYNIGKVCADLEVKPGQSCKNFWKGEMWIDIRNPVTWEVMKGRVKMAADKGCDGIDPDNMGMLSNSLSTPVSFSADDPRLMLTTIVYLDIYDNQVLSTNATYGPIGRNVKFSENDSVKYLKFMADEAAKYGMSIGLKNSLSIIPKVKTFVQFAVNEECAKIKECNGYNEFLNVRKPIFHIEYSKSLGTNAGTTRTTYKDPAAATKLYCNPLRESVSRFSTIIKAGQTLGNQYLYCDGKPAGFTRMAFYADKGGKAKGNFVEPLVENDEEAVGVDTKERFLNSTMPAELMAERKRVPTKRRHHRWAELERNPEWRE
ncbi:hypothetical protein FKW77_010172 [Venturia effusa]|uniref:alpha-galactosidase n=1 Tax=Venturia effusa TaxID=50376 RepID=A0A517L0E0_9PEZI|nr:hypothetical protein FKW77_010172 [Venturia effusa]